MDRGQSPSGLPALGFPKLGALPAGGLSSLFCRMGGWPSHRSLGRCGGGAAGSEGGRKGCECGGGPRAAPPRGGRPERSILVQALAAAVTAVGEGPSADMASRSALPGPRPQRLAQ